MKRLVIDLDGTRTRDGPERSCAAKEPDHAVVAHLGDYAADGLTIVIRAARNMRNFDNPVGRTNAHTLPVIIGLLKRHEFPYDEMHAGKPWCGDDGFYVDDRAVRPSEFISLPREQILDLIGPRPRR